jgi:hypothetical protein
MSKSIYALVLTLVVGAGTIVSCTSGGTPTAGSGMPDASSASTALSAPAPTGSSLGLTGNPAAQNEDEDFNCTNVQEVRARFSEPGFVQDTNVGFFVFFQGVQDTNMTLRLWWDFANAPESFEDVTLEQGDVYRENDLLTVDKVVEHNYSDVVETTHKRVRVELILADQTGNCARVRDVDVGPPVRGKGGKGGSITRWSDGTNAWPDEACNPTNSFGSCNTNAQNHADAWATAVCQGNGYSSGVWTGNKMPGCSGPISMWCGGNIPCTPIYETTCFAGDQTQIEFTCIP